MKKNREVLSSSIQGLGVIEGGGDSGAVLEKRRLPRWRLERVLFRSTLQGRLFSVVDLSTQGMSLLMSEEDLPHVSPGLCLQGVISIFSQKFQVQARVKSRYGNRVGCEFESLLESVQTHLADLLDPVSLGARLRPIPFQDQKAEWFVGPGGTSLMLQRGKGSQVSHVAVFILGTYSFWEKSFGWRTGTLIPSHDRVEARGLFQLHSHFLQPDEELDSLKLSIAKKLILSSNLSESLKVYCSPNFI